MHFTDNACNSMILKRQTAAKFILWYSRPGGDLHRCTSWLCLLPLFRCPGVALTLSFSTVLAFVTAYHASFKHYLSCHAAHGPTVRRVCLPRVTRWCRTRCERTSPCHRAPSDEPSCRHTGSPRPVSRRCWCTAPREYADRVHTPSNTGISNQTTRQEMSCLLS